MQTITARLVDGSTTTYPVKKVRYNQVWNNVDVVLEGGDSTFIHLHPSDRKWDNPYRCSENDATSVFVMNDAGQTVARYEFTGWDNCIKHDLQPTK